MREFHVNAAMAAIPRAAPRADAWRAGLAALLALLLAPSADAEDLLVGAAVSLREPLLGIARDFESTRPGSTVRLSFGASSTLAAQARAGAPLDVFVSADPRLVERLEREGWSEARNDVARNALVVVGAPGTPLEQPEDLLRVRRIALPARTVPVGRYARQWLEQQGLLTKLDTRIIQTEHARATLAAVDAGHADAALVYVTDARAVAAPRTLLALPDDEQPAILYAAALRADASEAAGAFFLALTNASARGRFADAGFGPP